MKELVEIGRQTYQLVEDYRNGFNKEDFVERYSDVLSKYDYIVGDWGYDQLRLKGFFDDQSKKANFDTKASVIDDYIYEYCNFGCAYFIVKKVDK